MSSCTCFHLSCSVVMLTSCSCCLFLYLLNCGSQLSNHNVARKEIEEPKVNENDLSIFAMENKTAWRIDEGEVEGCLQPGKLLDCCHRHYFPQFGKIFETSSLHIKFHAVNFNFQEMDDRVDIKSHCDIQMPQVKRLLFTEDLKEHTRGPKRA